MAELHVFMIPLMSQSHIIPLTNFAKLLARRGACISIFATPLNAERYKPTIDAAAAQNLKIRMIPLAFPSVEAGLPEACESLDSLESMDLILKFIAASKMLRAPIENLIREAKPPPNCIVSTTAMPWTQEIADAFKIPRYVLETVSCFTLSCSKIVRRAKEGVDSDSDPFPLPEIPHRIEFTKNQVFPDPTKDSSSGERKERPPDPARGTLMNTFQELEPWYLERLREERGKVWSIGPLSLSNRNISSIDEHHCLTWLDSMKPKSVIYVCFGSVCSMSMQQTKEIGLGLEASNSPFIWIIRERESNSTQLQEWLSGEGFEERVRGRGLVVRGWAPQVMILSHRSVGGFLTHCGWNSTLEGVCAGLPMMTWPMFAEQFFNEKLIVNVLGVGVRVGVESCMDKEGLVGWEKVKNGVEKLMNEKEGGERRERAEKLGKMANDAFEEGGSSFLNVTLFLEDVVAANKT